MSAEHGPGARLLTGGDVETIWPCLRGEYQWEPDLIFNGLRAIAGV